MQEFENTSRHIDWDERSIGCRDDEFILATFAPNLNQDLCFEHGVVVLTNQRIIHRQGENSWTPIDITETMLLRSRDSAGVKTLELVESGARHTAWHATLSQATAIHGFEEAFALQK